VSIGTWDIASIALKAQEDHRSVARRCATLCAAALVATALRIPVTAASMADGASGLLDAQLLGMVWHGGEQREAIARGLGLTLMLPGLLRGARPGIGSALAAAVAASSFAWVGHAQALASWSPRMLLAAHLIAAAFWLGALDPLSRYARGHEPRQVAAVCARFSAIALGMVGALLAAGVLLLWLMLGRWSALLGTGYGRTAFVKVSLVACLIGCAGSNKLWLTPRLAGGDHRALRWLRTSIAVEQVLAAAVLIVTAVLTTLMGPPSLGD
jgi:copper resistance protein D